ncbi:hypothetical protein B9Z51_08825 [Limnohabitans sp. T6-5]|nr:hypothetical protein B9Z51_08825 [Limnohabitans sp. T6-5]
MRALENVYRRRWQNPGQRSRAVRLLAEFNAKRMTFAGYAADEARASFVQCVDMAVLNINSGPLFAHK